MWRISCEMFANGRWQMHGDTVKWQVQAAADRRSPLRNQVAAAASVVRRVRPAAEGDGHAHRVHACAVAAPSLAVPTGFKPITIERKREGESERERGRGGEKHRERQRDTETEKKREGERGREREGE